jgi:hypothetical protein
MEEMVVRLRCEGHARECAVSMRGTIDAPGLCVQDVRAVVAAICDS